MLFRSDNWATCDSFSPKIFKKYPDEVYDKIKFWITSSHTYRDFWAFSRAGKTLGALHLGYETAEPWPLTVRESDAPPSGARFEDLAEYYRVEKMTFLHRGDQHGCVHALLHRHHAVGVPWEHRHPPAGCWAFDAFRAA